MRFFLIYYSKELAKNCCSCCIAEMALKSPPSHLREVVLYEGLSRLPGHVHVVGRRRRVVLLLLLLQLLLPDLGRVLLQDLLGQLVDLLVVVTLRLH